MSAASLHGIVEVSSKERADGTALVRVPSATNPAESAVVVISPQAEENAEPYRPKWISKEEMLARRGARTADKRQAIRHILVQAALERGMIDEAMKYVGAPVRRRPGRPVGSPSRWKLHVMNDAERLAVARAVHVGLGNPKPGAKLPRGYSAACSGMTAMWPVADGQLVSPSHRKLTLSSAPPSSVADHKRPKRTKTNCLTQPSRRRR